MKINFLEKIVDTLHLNFFNRINSDNTKNVMSSSGGDIAGRDLHKTILSHNASKLEKRVLKLLHLEYERSGFNGRKISHIFKELDIKDGIDVSTINDSQLLETSGDFFKMTPDGIRYMDNLELSDLNKIILPKDQRKKDVVMQEQKRRFNKSRKNKRKNSYR